MRKLIMGVVWIFLLMIVFSVAGGFFYGTTGHTDAGAPKYMGVVVLLSFVVGIVGTVLGVLPGTKSR